MSDWRQSRPEDFALTEKRGYTTRDPDPPRRQGPDWLPTLSLGMLLGAVPTLVLTWFVMSPSSDAGLQARLLEQARQIDTLNTDVAKLTTEKEAIQKRVDAYVTLEQHIESVCQNVWVPTSAASTSGSVISKKTFCQSFVDKFPALFTP